MTKNELSARLAVETAVDLHRVAEGFIVGMMVRLHQLEADIVAAIALRRDGRASFQLEAILDDTNKLIAEAFTELANRVEQETDDLAEAVQERERRNWLLLFGFPVTAAILLPTGAEMLVAGATARSWLWRQGGDFSFRVNALIRNAFSAAGATGGAPDLGELIHKLQGRTPDSPTPTIAQTERAAQTTVKTTAETVGTKVREAVGLAGGESAPSGTVIRYGWQQISVLDSRTTDICRAYAFKIWNASFEPVGHSLPYDGGVPRHPNCRSTICIHLLDEDPLKDMTFGQWLRTLTEAQQASIFGPGRMKLWREGKITDADLIDQQRRALTLDEFNNKTAN